MAFAYPMGVPLSANIPTAFLSGAQKTYIRPGFAFDCKTRATLQKSIRQHL